MVNAAGGGGGGGGTPFEGMSHEQMLAWLDQASSFHVRDAGDRLARAAGEIRNIALQLKFRPERVEWQGEGFEAFVEWGASLSGATYRLADYSDEASKWLKEAATSIAAAQSGIPRYTSKGSAQESLDAAKAYRNDPDSRLVQEKAEAALAASQESQRLEAAAEMRKLSQSYQQSSSQMAKQEVPTFQPPPEQFVPRDDGIGGAQGTDVARSTAGGSGSEASYGSPVPSSGAPSNQASAVRGDVVPPGGYVRPEGASVAPSSPVSLGIDSVAAPAQSAPSAPTVSPTPPSSGRSDVTALPPVTGAPPVMGGGSVKSQGGGPGGLRPGIGGGRGPVAPVTGQQVGGTGPVGPAGRVSREGVVGGRPVPPAQSGRAATGLPRGMVVGTESGVHGRPPMAHGAGGPTGGGVGAGQSGVVGGRRLAGEPGGIVGGRPAQPGVAAGRPFTPGGSGLVRGRGASGVSGGGAGQSAGVRGGMMPPASSSRAGSRRDDADRQRPDYLTEDEETWQQNQRRVAPPVID
ncbi:WXG100 family type VII secretion target [Streptomyces sp. MUM 178J]|uniref:WXG100 family type VII secretion target n=1 Tax=Streptomyces sp. MUM 178J TaxID=2791991 RepID=UPI001F047095|nr:hypothetical protein [Streptomyces sp. MUM 178J]WRQ81604.1 hypothetical protein I3F59_020855 [Streptomyces sp. MUM 178J]